jgi:circadian clock protein KaiC
VTDRVRIEKLFTGVSGLDDALGGGIPDLSFTLIAGGPGAGKTTLAHQLMFGMASEARPALYITILGEPPLKMLRYQQQFTFFDPAKIPQCIRFLHLGSELLEHGIDAVLTQIVREVERTAPKLVFVDSFRALASKSQEAGQMELQSFVQRLSLHLTSWEATTFLVGEYEQREAESASIFTVADGIVWLSQATSRNSVVRTLQIMKLRGQASIPGLHTIKIGDSGLRVFPRITSPQRRSAPPSEQRIRRSVGSPELDAMLGGGIPAGYSVLIAGPSGSGKTVLATQFLRAGIAEGERGVLAVFETPTDEYLATAPDGASLTQLVAEGKLSVLYLRPLDLSVDETMDAIASAVQRTGATRVVIDSLMGLELALAPSFRDDFRESLYRMVGALTALGVTIVMTAELTTAVFELALSPHEISFLTDAIIVQRYVEMSGELRRLMFVAKLRALPHSKELRLYDVTHDGIALGEDLTSYDGVLSGFVRRASLDDE